MLPLILLALGAAALAGTTLLAYLYASWGVGLVLFSVVFGLFLEQTPPIVVLGPIQVYFTDVVIVALAAAATLRLIHLAGRSRLPLPLIVLLVLGLVLAISFVRGFTGFSPQEAGVEYRRYLGFLTFAAYVASFRPEETRLRNLMWLWLGTTIVLCVVVLYRWAVAIAGGAVVERLRVIDAGDTLIVAQAMLMCFHLILVPSSSRFARGLAAVFLPFVVLLQHRTVWVATVVALVVVGVREGRLRTRLMVVAASAVAVVAVGSLLLYGDQSDEVLATSASDTNTLVWRLIGWRALLEDHVEDPVVTLFGKPFGAGFERFLPELGYTVDVSPHNFYITLLLRGGVIALVLFLVLYAGILRGTARGAGRRQEAPVGYRTSLVLVVTQLVFFLSYDPLPVQGVPMGIALALACVSEPAQSPVPLRPPAAGGPAPSTATPSRARRRAGFGLPGARDGVG